ncbi:FeoB-associated Cys-rich membrane protein [Bacillus sp. FJAT-29790]|uniref:FeoB-associated Cys-rich membrane protein n=1 Tax=Bacillus sp. FJAT-29790 TaxID=1895002 RepID=UPI001C2318FB|nr:FeoB-associated Cys-rich membrane protein [Bacillus sp. FJAT-29790]MBU8880054.1 FeoB-associated Cys-rich membrane protein [Bacillus sp. FJAT-29790]
MVVNFIIGGLIFGYASWSLIKFIKKSKQGKCASCSAKKSCTSSCGPISIKK